MPTNRVETVLAWHAALNAGDVERLLSLSTPDVEVGGPRGIGSGADLLREWAARAGITLEPLRVWQRDQTVVVEARARWRATGDSQPAESAAQGDAAAAGRAVASAFRVSTDGARVQRVVRYDDAASALAAVGLGPGDARPLTG